MRGFKNFKKVEPLTNFTGTTIEYDWWRIATDEGKVPGTYIHISDGLDPFKDTLLTYDTAEQIYEWLGRALGKN